MVALASAEWIEWLNYPGLEAWKFANLAIFTTVAVYLLRRKVSEALSARRDAIRQELLKAHEERERALAQLGEAEALLERLGPDIRTVQEQARQEAESERHRLAISTEREIEKLKLQAEREIEMAAKVARKELRQVMARRSVELARESIRSQIEPEDDRRLIKESIGELRRIRV